MARDVVAQPSLRDLTDAELSPGAGVQTDGEIDAWVRQFGETIYHPVGTAKMGLEGDPMAVVNAELKVIGLDGLRVVDASAMPTLVGGNTNAPTIMLAEKAADMIRGRAALPAEAVGDAGRSAA
jgi:choline dehydrogenase